MNKRKRFSRDTTNGFTLSALAVLTGFGFAAFVWRETKTPAPLVRLDLLRERTLSGGLTSLMLVSAIMMATLVVGPFYLTEVLDLDSIHTGLVMSVGPVVAAVTGVPAGRLVDRLGSFPVIVTGLVAVMTGALLLTMLPGLYGVGGYAVSLVVITLGYGLFQAANMTAVMQGASTEHRGLISALLGLSRNLGLISGASAMGAVYAMGPRFAEVTGVDLGDGAGLILAFSVSVGLAGVALGSVIWGQMGRSFPER